MPSAVSRDVFQRSNLTPPLNSFLWFTDNFFATRGIYKWCILVSQSNLFNGKRHNYFFRHHSKLPLTLQFSNSCNRRQETVSIPQLSPPQSLPLGNSIQIKKSSNRKMESAGRTLSSVLSPQPPYNTKKPLWRRCLNIVLNNKTRPLVFGIQSML